MPALFALLALAACNKTVPPAKPAPLPEISQSIQFYSGHLLAMFENGEQAAIYFDTLGASVMLPAKGQFEIDGQYFCDRTGWRCIDRNTGDYIVLYRNGFASAMLRGMHVNLMPAKIGTEFATK